MQSESRVRMVMGAVVVCLLSFVTALATSAAAAESPAGLTLQDLHDQPQSLEMLRGSVVVVNFWATWCVPCRDEMPIFVRMQRRFGDDGVRVIGASTDETASRDEVARFARKLKLNFPVWVGATVADMERFGLGSALPATVILDRDGSIVERIPGVVDAHDLAERLEWLVSDRSAPAPAREPIEPDDDDAEHPADHPAEHGDDHDHAEGEEEHQHGGVGMEGASLVPS